MILHKIHKYWWNEPTFGPGIIALLVLASMTIHCIHWEGPNPIKFYICIFAQGSNIDYVVTKELESKLEKLIQLLLAIHTLHLCQETSKTWFPKHFVWWELQLATSSPPAPLAPCPLLMLPVQLALIFADQKIGQANTNCVRRIITTGKNHSRTCPIPFQTYMYCT